MTPALAQRISFSPSFKAVLANFLAPDSDDGGCCPASDSAPRIRYSPRAPQHPSVLSSTSPRSNFLHWPRPGPPCPTFPALRGPPSPLRGSQYFSCRHGACPPALPRLPAHAQRVSLGPDIAPGPRLGRPRLMLCFRPRRAYLLPAHGTVLPQRAGLDHPPQLIMGSSPRPCGGRSTGLFLRSLRPLQLRTSSDWVYKHGAPLRGTPCSPGSSGPSMDGFLSRPGSTRPLVTYPALRPASRPGCLPLPGHAPLLRPKPSPSGFTPTARPRHVIFDHYRTSPPVIRPCALTRMARRLLGLLPSSRPLQSAGLAPLTQMAWTVTQAQGLSSVTSPPVTGPCALTRDGQDGDLARLL